MSMLSEAELQEFILRDKLDKKDTLRASEFSAFKNEDGLWELKFLTDEKFHSSIITRRNEPRVFLRINGLIKFAEKVGIRELALKL